MLRLLGWRLGKEIIIMSELASFDLSGLFFDYPSAFTSHNTDISPPEGLSAQSTLMSLTLLMNLLLPNLLPPLLTRFFPSQLLLSAYLPPLILLLPPIISLPQNIYQILNTSPQSPASNAFKNWARKNHPDVANRRGGGKRRGVPSEELFGEVRSVWEGVKDGGTKKIAYERSVSYGSFCTISSMTSIIHYRQVWTTSSDMDGLRHLQRISAARSRKRYHVVHLHRWSHDLLFYRLWRKRSTLLRASCFSFLAS
jgi:hypothetical protein